MPTSDRHEEYVSKLSEHYHKRRSEGQLSIDVLETKDEIIVKSAIAGVSKDDLHITVTTDTLTVRGERSHAHEQKNTTAHIRECYWGAFSRSIVLPNKVLPDKTEATLTDGILTIRLKKAEISSEVPIKES